MNRKILRIGIFCAVVGFTFSAKAQDYIEKKVTDKNGKVSLVTFKSDSNLESLSKVDLFKKILNISAETELRLTKSENDFTGNFLDEKYQQFYKGIPVEFGVYNLHYKKGSLSSMNGELFSTNNFNSTASISKENALQKAIESVSAKKYMWDSGYGDSDYNKKPIGELVMVPMLQADESYKLVLAYKFDIFAAEPISRANIYINANSGEVLLSDPIMKHSASSKEELNNNPFAGVLTKEVKLKMSLDNLVTANAATRYSGNQSIETSLSGSNYILSDVTRGGGVRTYNIKKGTNTGTAVDFTDVDNNWTAAEFDNTNFDNAALDAHWGVEKTYDYFKSKFNRNSYDNLGTLLKSYVHYSTNYDNAGWTGSYMIYGDGATTFYPLTGFDVTAHELGHGVCSSSAALAYQRESGALNEGFSDIWGAAVEHEYAPTKSAFLIGEDITKTSPFYLRSMSNPKAVGQPDTYRGENWSPATAAEGCATPGPNTNDNCGVHNNSGVLNHWFYILVQGKTGTNDIGKSYSVTGIGFDKAAAIAYRAEVNYLTANSTFINTRDFGMQAATDLYGANSPEFIATQDAFYAVGLGAKYNPSGPDTVIPSTPLNLTANSTTNVSTYLTWDASTDNFALDGYNVYKNGVLLGSTYNTNYYVTGLTASTLFNFKVEAKDEAGNKSNFSNQVSVTTLATGNTYCTSQATTTSFMKIKNVKLNTIDNTSTGGAGYEDFSYLSTDVAKGSTYTISITPFWSSTVYPLRYAVYIDYNNNGLFTDSGDAVWTQSANIADAIVTGTFTIPSGTINGVKRVRVSASYNTTITSCATIAYGQVEDYSVNVQNAIVLAASNTAKESLATIYPNPVKEVVNILGKAKGDFNYQIYNSVGQVVLKGKSADNKINAKSLISGNYIIELTDKNGEKTTQKFIKK